MADEINMSPEDMEKFNAFIKDVTKNGVGFDKAVKKFAKSLSGLTESSLADINKQFSDFDKQLKKAGGSYKSSIKDIRDLHEAIEESADLQKDENKAKKAEMIERVKNYSRGALIEEARIRSTQAVGAVISAQVSGYVKQLRATVTGLTNGSSAFKTAQEVQIASIDATQQTVQGVTNAVSAFGSALITTFNPYAMAVGGLLIAGSTLASMISGTMAEYDKAKLEVVVNGIEKTYSMFQQVSSAGAMFANGMTEMSAVQREAGLTYEEFAKVAVESKQSLAGGFGTVTDGLKQLGDVMNKLATTRIAKSGLTIQRELQNLGYTVAEQASLVTDVMSNMAYYGKKLTPDEVVAQTVEYGKNLKLIADITGKDAKSKIKEANDIVKMTAYRNLIMKNPNGEKQMQDINTLNTTLPKNIAEAIREFAVTKTTTHGEVYDIPGLAPLLQQIGEEQAQGRFDLKSAATRLANITENVSKNQFQSSISSAAILGKGGPDIMARETMYQELIESNIALKKLPAAVAEMSKAKVPEKDTLGTSIQDSMQQFRNLGMEVEQKLQKPMNDFAKYVQTEMIPGMRKQMELLGIFDKVTTTIRNPTADQIIQAGANDMLRPRSFKESLDNIAHPFSPDNTSTRFTFSDSIATPKDNPKFSASSSNIPDKAQSDAKLSQGITGFADDRALKVLSDISANTEKQTRLLETGNRYNKQTMINSH